jgi:hypothetical protein
MNTYVIYNSVTGQINRIVVCNNIEQQLKSGETYIEGTIDDSKYYVDVDTETFVEFPPKPAPYDTWDWNTHSWVDARTLVQAQDQKWAQIKLNRDAAINAPLTTPYGVFDADPSSRANISNAVLYLQTLEQQGTPGTVDWTLADNSTITLNYQEMSQVGLLLGQRTNAAYDTARALRTQIYAATTIAEVEAIHWPT